MSNVFVLSSILGAAIFLLVAAVAWLAVLKVRSRALDRWMFTYVRQWTRYRAQHADQPMHMILCIADHFEPGNGGVTADQARERVQRWVEEYPIMFGRFHDSDGHPPRHTFFYPLEQYDPEHLDALAGLCRRGFGEIEVHLHHDRDNADELRARLVAFKKLLSRRHGLLPQHKQTGKLFFGFIHGNWALDNSRPDGRCCGVNNELDILCESGCYADFTLPSAPDETQTRKINSIYYACDDPLRPKSHDWGSDVGIGPAPTNGLMMIQGPLLLNWRNRKWGLLPRLENGCLQESQPPSISRLNLWLRARVQVRRRPDWFFVKLHTHGAPEDNSKVLLGEPMIRFHQDMARLAAENHRFHYHYVTAREMYNLVRAAEDRWTGTVDAARNYELVWNGYPQLKAPVEHEQDLELNGRAGSR
jgi:hypothetical protein